MDFTLRDWLECPACGNDNPDRFNIHTGDLPVISCQKCPESVIP